MGRFGGILLIALLPLAAAGVARAEPACARANFRLVVDVGHTADAPGAWSARGVPEFQFNLKLAQLIEKTLSEAGFAKTVLLVSTGPGIRSMYDRVARANALSANLLLSIHHDAVPKAFLEKWEYEGKPAVYSDRFKGHSIFVADGNADRKASLLFGQLLGGQLKARGLQYTPHYTEGFMGKFQRNLVDAEAGVYRYDTLFLLKKSVTPAVLFEAGSIINRDEELLMGSPEHQALISAAVAEAVESFCAAQTPRPVLQVARARARHAHKRIRTVPADALAQIWVRTD